jgi:magnesium-protoporphyrin O-methyltransferase
MVGQPDPAPGNGDQAGSPICGTGCPCSTGNEFGEKAAARGARTYRRSGPVRTTRWLLHGLGVPAAAGPSGDPGVSDATSAPMPGAGDVASLTVLDIGAGVGAVHLELLRAGAASAVDVDGSPAYVAVARAEAARLGVDDRIAYAIGDFVELAPSIQPADLVALDRVVCCYPDMGELVGLSVARARRRYGLVYPRDTWWIRVGGRAFNLASRLARQRLRLWIHRTADVDAIVRAAGFTPRLVRTGLFWQVVVYERL